MLNLVPDVGSSDVVVKAIWVILNDDLSFIFTFILPLNKLLVQGIVGKWLYK